MSRFQEYGMKMGWVGMGLFLPMVAGAMSFAIPDREQSRRAIGTILYLLPLGEFRAGAAPALDLLREYAAAYFALEVRVLPTAGLSGQGIAARQNPSTRNRQLLTTDILAALKKRIPHDAFCLLGITMEDLYPKASWNFLFGQASLRERVGVYSLARYAPAFHGGPRGPDHARTLLRGSCRVLAHETGHMFGLAHCLWFHCVFNGSNHLAASDACPLHECAVDLRQLHGSIGFDVPARYARLYRFYRKVEFDDEAVWTRTRLERIVGGAEARRIIETIGEGTSS